MAFNRILHNQGHLYFIKTSRFMHYTLVTHKKSPQNCERLGEVYPPPPHSNYLVGIFFSTFYIYDIHILLHSVDLDFKILCYFIFLYDFQDVQRIIVQLENGGIRIQESIL